MTLRVLMISHNYPHPARPGDGQFVHRQAQSLRDIGVAVHVVSPVPYAPPLPGMSGRIRAALAVSRSKPRHWQIDGIEVDYPRYLKLPGAVELGTFGPLCYRGIRSLVHKLHAAQPFDLMHGQWLVPDGYAAARLGYELGIPSVSSERGYAARYPDRGPRAAAIRKAIESVGQVVTVSQAMARRVCELGTPKRPIRVVYTGVDAVRFSCGNRQAAWQQLGLPQGRYLVCCARVEPVKQPPLLLEAFRRVHAAQPEARLVWLGEGSELPSLREAARGAGLAERVHLPGRVAHDDIPCWLAAADVVVLASRSEGLPNALVEAAAAGRPVVATRVGGVPELVEEGVTGLLVAPDDAEEFAAAVLTLLGEPERADALGRRARQMAIERFSWQRHAAEMLEVYRALVPPCCAADEGADTADGPSR